MKGKFSPETIQKYDDILVPHLIRPYGHAYRDALLWEQDADFDISIYIQLYGFTLRQVFKYCEQSYLPH